VRLTEGPVSTATVLSRLLVTAKWDGEFKLDILDLLTAVIKTRFYFNPSTHKIQVTHSQCSLKITHLEIILTNIFV
jgi:hypothetical protein